MPLRESPDFDKLLKIMPLLECIRVNSQTLYYPDQQVAVDKAMILFKGQSSLKQYMPKKPTKCGFKAWHLCDSQNGYIMYNNNIYTGKVASTEDNTDDGLGARVVKSLVGPLYDKRAPCVHGQFHFLSGIGQPSSVKEWIHGWDSVSVIQRMAATTEAYQGHQPATCLWEPCQQC